MGACENALVHAISCSKGIGVIDTAGREKNKGTGLKAPSIGCCLPLLLTWSCEAQFPKAQSSLGTSVHALAHARLSPGSPAGSALTRFPGILDCLVQVFISKVSILVFPLIQILLHGAQAIFHSRSCFIGLSSCRFGILDRLFCVLWKERRKISGMARSGEEAPLGHSLGVRKGAERTSLATPQDKPWSLPSMSCTDWSWLRSCSFFTRRSASLSFAICRVPLIAAIKEMRMLCVGSQSSSKDITPCKEPLSPPLSFLCCLLTASSRLLLFLFSSSEMAPRFSDMTLCKTNMHCLGVCRGIPVSGPDCTQKC